MKVNTNHQLSATRVADKSNQSCPLQHLTSNKITSINKLSYEWLDFVCFQSTREGGRGGGAAQFSQWLKQGQIGLITSRTLLWLVCKGRVGSKEAHTVKTLRTTLRGSVSRFRNLQNLALIHQTMAALIKSLNSAAMEETNSKLQHAIFTFTLDL